MKTKKEIVDLWIKVLKRQHEILKGKGFKPNEIDYLLIKKRKIEK